MARQRQHFLMPQCNVDVLSFHLELIRLPIIVDDPIIDWIEQENSVRDILGFVIKLLKSISGPAEINGMDTIGIDSLDEALEYLKENKENDETSWVVKGQANLTIVSYLLEFRTKVAFDSGFNSQICNHLYSSSCNCNQDGGPRNGGAEPAQQNLDSRSLCRGAKHEPRHAQAAVRRSIHSAAPNHRPVSIQVGHNHLLEGPT